MTHSASLIKAREEQPHPQPMNPNHLIYRGTIGHAKPSAMDLPADEHRYGAPLARDPEGVGQLLQWKSADYGVPSPKTITQSKPFSVDQLPENFIFGAPNRAHTPIEKLVTHTFNRETEQAYQDRYQQIRSEKIEATLQKSLPASPRHYPPVSSSHQEETLNDLLLKAAASSSRPLKPSASPRSPFSPTALSRAGAHSLSNGVNTGRSKNGSSPMVSPRRR